MTGKSYLVALATSLPQSTYVTTYDPYHTDISSYEIAIESSSKNAATPTPYEFNPWIPCGIIGGIRICGTRVLIKLTIT